jgi:catechol 2,3-dioxygenase-like lactoylglutathione lyase family enzyme
MGGSAAEAIAAQPAEQGLAMLDHVFLSVSDIERSIAFYTQALAPLGITDRVDFDGKDGQRAGLVWPCISGFQKRTPDASRPVRKRRP